MLHPKIGLVFDLPILIRFLLIVVVGHHAAYHHTAHHTSTQTKCRSPSGSKSSTVSPRRAVHALLRIAAIHATVVASHGVPPAVALLRVSAAVMPLLRVSSSSHVLLRRPRAASAKLRRDLREQALLARFLSRRQLVLAVGARTPGSVLLLRRTSVEVIRRAAMRRRPARLLLLLQPPRHGLVALVRLVRGPGTLAIGIVARERRALLRRRAGRRAVVVARRCARRVRGLRGHLPCCFFRDRVGVEPRLVLVVPDRLPARGDLWRRWALCGACAVSCCYALVLATGVRGLTEGGANSDMLLRRVPCGLCDRWCVGCLLGDGGRCRTGRVG